MGSKSSVYVAPEVRPTMMKSPLAEPGEAKSPDKAEIASTLGLATFLANDVGALDFLRTRGIERSAVDRPRRRLEVRGGIKLGQSRAVVLLGVLKLAPLPTRKRGYIVVMRLLVRVVAVGRLLQIDLGMVEPQEMADLMHDEGGEIVDP
jgi:hypothetical protein